MASKLGTLMKSRSNSFHHLERRFDVVIKLIWAFDVLSIALFSSELTGVLLLSISCVCLGRASVTVQDVPQMGNIVNLIDEIAFSFLTYHWERFSLCLHETMGVVICVNRKISLVKVKSPIF